MEANRLAPRRHSTENLSQLVNTLLHIREVPNSNIGLETGCYDKHSALIQFLSGVRHSSDKQGFHIQGIRGPRSSWGSSRSPKMKDMRVSQMKTLN